MWKISRLLNGLSLDIERAFYLSAKRLFYMNIDIKGWVGLRMCKRSNKKMKTTIIDRHKLYTT